MRPFPPVTRIGLMASPPIGLCAKTWDFDWAMWRPCGGQVTTEWSCHVSLLGHTGFLRRSC